MRGVHECLHLHRCPVVFVKIQAKLPRYILGKPGAWDPGVCLTSLDSSLTWLRKNVEAAPEGVRFRLEYSPTTRSGLSGPGRTPILLVRDPSIRPFVQDPSESTLYSLKPAARSGEREF